MLKELNKEDYKYDLDGKKLTSDFNNLISNTPNLLIKFSATWCGPCKAMKKMIERLEPQFKDITFLEVDVDSFDSLASKYQVSSIPTFMFFKDGKPLNVNNDSNIFIGSMDEDDFVSLLKKFD